MEYQKSKEQILEKYPSWHPYLDEERFVFFINTSQSKRQLILQYHEGSWWIRFSEPHSGYATDSLEELFPLLDLILEDRISIAVGYQEGVWKETTLVKDRNLEFLDEGITYHLLSFSGAQDSIVTIG